MSLRMIFALLGSVHWPVVTSTVFFAAQVSASALVRKPLFVRFLPSGLRYWTRQACPVFVWYLVMLAIIVYFCWQFFSLLSL